MSERCPHKPDPFQSRDACDTCYSTLQNDFNNEISNQANQRRPIKMTNKRRIFVCTICGKAKVSSSRLIAHKRSHTQQSSFSCIECPVGVDNKEGPVGPQQVQIGIETKSRSQEVISLEFQRLAPSIPLTLDGQQASAYIDIRSSIGSERSQKRERSIDSNQISYIVKANQNEYVCTYPGCERRFASHYELARHLTYGLHLHR